MKNKSILYLTVLLSLFIACSNSQKQTTENKIPRIESNSIQEKDTFPSELGNSINNIEGVWIRKDYIENLKNSLSPAASYKFIENISVLIIDSSSNSKLTVGVIYNNHEGGELVIDYLNNQPYLIYNTKEGNEKSIINVDGIALKVQVENVYYEFYKFPLRYRDNPIKYVTDSILFDNKVFNSVSPSTGIKMTLSKDGRSYNFDKYEKFEVETDFMVYEDYYDIIRFYEDNGKSKAFKYYFNNNVLEFRGFGKESDSILYKFEIINLP